MKILSRRRFSVKYAVGPHCEITRNLTKYLQTTTTKKFVRLQIFLCLSAKMDYEEYESRLFTFIFQEKYLSEHNYDEPIDVDRTLKLLNFGDDYSKFIDSMSDEFSDLEQNQIFASKSQQQPRTKRKVRRSVWPFTEKK